MKDWGRGGGGGGCDGRREEEGERWFGPGGKSGREWEKDGVEGLKEVAVEKVWIVHCGPTPRATCGSTYPSPPSPPVHRASQPPPPPSPQVYSLPSLGLLLQAPLCSLLGQAWEPPPPGSKAPPPSRLIAATRLGHLALLNAQVGVMGGWRCEQGVKCGQQGAAPFPPDSRNALGPPGPAQRPGWCDGRVEV